MTDSNLTLSVTSWSPDELRSITETDDLHVAPFRRDGETTGTPTGIWNVVVDGDLYVRAYNGTKSSWYQAAVREEAGEIEAAGRTHTVNFEPVEGAINDRIDAAYREKYARQSLPRRHGLHPGPFCHREGHSRERKNDCAANSTHLRSWLRPS